MPNVVMLNARAVEDLVVHDGRITGVVANSTLVARQHGAFQPYVNPNVITASVTVSATGHGGPMGALCAKRLVSAGPRELPEDIRQLDMSGIESVMVQSTREVAPGLIMAGQK